MGDRLTCVLPITPRLQHCSFLACWPLHKPFWGGKIHFFRSLEEQHCTHFTKFCLRSVRQSISCAPLSVASILWKLKINSTFWFPFYQPLYCTHAEAAGLLHSYIISVQAASQFLGCCLALHASYFFNLLKKPYITTTLLSARPNMELAKSHCSAVSTDIQLKVIWKEQEREWEREHDKRKWRRKEKGPENDEKCSCHCRYLQFFSCMQHLQTLKVEPHHWKGFNWKDGSSCTFPTDFLWYKQPVLFPDN